MYSMYIAKFGLSCDLLTDGVVSEDGEVIELASNDFLNRLRTYVPYAQRVSIPLCGRQYVVVELEDNELFDDLFMCVRFDASLEETSWLDSLTYR